MPAAFRIKMCETPARHREFFQVLRPYFTCVGIGRTVEEITTYSIRANECNFFAWHRGPKQGKLAPTSCINGNTGGDSPAVLRSWHHSQTGPTRGGRFSRGPGSLVKDSGNKSQDAHTQLVRVEKKSRKHRTAL